MVKVDEYDKLMVKVIKMVMLLELEALGILLWCTYCKTRRMLTYSARNAFCDVHPTAIPDHPIAKLGRVASIINT